jgi:phenylacetaldehyde dehydrogenase
MVTAEAIERARGYAARPHALLIDGKAVQAGAGATLEAINPADGARIGLIAAGDSRDVDLAVAAARRAFDAGPWPRMSPGERARLLMRVADLIESNAQELAALETLDNGKPVAAAMMADLPAAADAFRYYAGWCDKLAGATLPVNMPAEFHAYTSREPVGVVALIIPWNFPLMQAATKIAAALAAGCTTVVKPAEQTSLTTLRLGELILEAGAPAGVVNIVTGDGPGAGAPLAGHRDVDHISFTGSTQVGRIIARLATENLKKVTLELGGKSPTIILDDADLDAAIAGAGMAIFSNAGQVCVAGSRLLASRKVYADVVEGLAERARAIKVGPGLDLATEMGPLVSQQHRDRVLGYVRAGREEGAKVRAGGEALNQPGFYMQPTVLADARPEMKVAAEEIFGPVLSAAPFDDLADVPRLANASRFGLSANIWTRDVSQAHRLARQMQAGLVWVNTWGASSTGIPYGGYKESGWGREGGLEGLLEYTQQKSVVVAL